VQIQTDNFDRAVIATLSGRAESGTAEDFKVTIERLLDAGHREIVVNLERV
jgi:hypothetical protein